MQLSLPWRRGQAKPFDSVPRINWAHPIAQGLYFYVYDAGACYIDLVSGGCSTQVRLGTTHSNFGTSAFGGGKKLDASNPFSEDFLFLPVSRGASLCGTVLPYTIGIGVVSVGTQTAASGASASQADTTLGGSNKIGASFNVNSSAAGKMTINWFSTFSDFSTPLSSKTFQTYFAIPTSATAADYYGNGVFESNHIGLNATTGGAGDVGQIIINGDTAGGAGTGGLTGFQMFYAGWNRNLTATEILQLQIDPWCLLWYPEDDIFATLVGVTGPAPPSSFVFSTIEQTTWYKTDVEAY
jgi:hypothetical protein